MKEERLAVLRLLENGVINADEAERLLNTLRPAVIPPSRMDAFNEKMAAAGENIANFAKKAGKTVGKTTENAAKKAEPVLKKAAEKLGEKTEDVCTSAKNYIDKKKAEREKSYVPDIDDKDVEIISDEEVPAEENPVGEADALKEENDDK